MDVAMTVSGKTTICMELESILGKTAEDMMANTLMTESMATVSTSGKTAVSMRVAGKTESSTEKERTSRLTGRSVVESGRTERESDGSMSNSEDETDVTEAW
jgi:hypothetical protein